MRHLRPISIAATVGMVFTLAPLSLVEDTAHATDDSPQSCMQMHGGTDGEDLQPPIEVENQYEITSARQLVFLSENFDKPVGNGDSDTWGMKSFVQDAPIDLGGCVFTPIGRLDYSDDTLDAPFSGSYAGLGLPIDGLVVHGSDSPAGLFGATSGASILDVVIRNATISSSAGNVGALVGYADDTNISLVRVTGEITASGNSVGGLVGAARLGTVIDESSAVVTVTREQGSAGASYGGLVGLLTSASSIVESFARGSVSAGDGVGGLLGSSGEASSGQGNSISRSYSTVSVTGADGVGGLVGFLPNSANLAITDSYAAGPVSGDRGVGGLIGAKAESGVTLTVTGSFWDVDTTGQAGSLDGEGTGQTTEEMKTLSTFENAGWVFIADWDDYPETTKWGLRSNINDGYPYLLWEYADQEPWFCGVLDVDGFYQVSNAEELANVGAGGLSGPCSVGDQYRQTENIDLSEWGPWTPIGANMGLLTAFYGHYDGGGFRIENMSIESEWTLSLNSEVRDSFSGGGLFSYLSGATIENLTIADADYTLAPTTGLAPNPDDEVRAAASGAGLLAGAASGSTIDNVHVSGTLDNLDTVAGGLIGAAVSLDEDLTEEPITTTISHCSVDVTMTTVNDAEIVLGGIVGAVFPGANVEISSCDDVTVNTDVSLAATPQFLNIFEMFRLNVDESDPVGGLVGIVGGVVGGIDTASSLTLSDVSVSAESSIIVTVENPGAEGLAPFEGSSLALGGLLGFALGSLQITDSTVGSTPAEGSQQDADAALLVVQGEFSLASIGGLVGFSIGLIPGDETTDFEAQLDPDHTLEITNSSAATVMVIVTDSFVLSAGGLIGVASNPTIVSSQAMLNLGLETNSLIDEAQFGGLIGSTIDADIDRSEATINFEVTTGENSEVEAILAGGLLGESTSGTGEVTVRQSSAQGAMTFTPEGIVGLVNTGGLIGELDGPGVIQDLWSAVEITVDATRAPAPPEGDNGEVFGPSFEVGGGFGVVGFFDSGEPGDPDAPTLSVRNVLARGSTQLQPPTGPHSALIGSFAAVIDIDPESENVTAEGNFALESDPTPLVGDTSGIGFLTMSAEDFGVTALSDAELTTITPYQSAGWGIMAASVGSLPSGPDSDEVWGIGISGTCAPYLWWQFDHVAASCLSEQTGLGGEDTTDVTGPGATQTPTTTNSSDSPADGQTVITPLAPAPSTGPNPLAPAEPESDTVETVDEPAESGEQANADGSETTEASDPAITPINPTNGINTGLLWAIGLGSLGIAGAIAGGVAFARTRV